MNASARQPTRLAELSGPTWDALRDVVVLLPIGSTEQHSAHLPMGTDTALAIAVCEAAGARSERLVVAPALPFGASRHHQGLPGGAVSVAPRVLVDLLVAIVSDLVDPSRRRGVFLVNGHGGNSASVACALDELGTQRGELPVAACSWWQLVPDLLDGADPAVPDTMVGHAGAVETSAMLAAQPQLVHTDAAIRGEGQALPAAAGVHRWRDFSVHFPDGVIGSPRHAEVDLGRRLIAAAGERLARLAHELLG